MSGDFKLPLSLRFVLGKFIQSQLTIEESLWLLGVTHTSKMTDQSHMVANDCLFNTKDIGPSNVFTFVSGVRFS